MIRLNLARAGQLLGYFLFYFIAYSAAMFFFHEKPEPYWTLSNILGNIAFAYFMVLVLDDVVGKSAAGPLISIPPSFSGVNRLLTWLLAYFMLGLAIELSAFMIAVPVLMAAAGPGRYMLPKDLLTMTVLLAVMTLLGFFLKTIFSFFIKKIAREKIR